jgi:hypothetical protein
VASPLYYLQSKELTWKKGPLPEKALNAFETLKNALCSEPVIAYPRSDRTFSLIVDAATGKKKKKGGLGEIICQTDKQGDPRVISYASRALTISEKITLLSS